MLVTGSPPVRGGGGMPQRIVTISVPASRVADDWRRIVRKDARHRRQIADVAIDHEEEAMIAAWLVVML